MSTEAPAFTIVHRLGEKSETVVTGLSREEARDWLKSKASEVKGSVTSDLVLKHSGGDESWAGVESE
jgi:hypothetical protein